MAINQKKKNFDALLAQFYSKLNELKARRNKLLKQLDQQQTDQDLKNIQNKIKNL